MPENSNNKKYVAEALNLKKFPKDLAFVLIWLVLAILAIYIPGVNETVIRVIFAVPVILFIPGYALIAALFPQKYTKTDDESETETKKKRSGISGIERFALSVGLSLAVVPLIGLILNYTPFGIRLNPVVISLVIFTVIMVMIALFRRAKLPEDERFYVPFEKVAPFVKEEVFPEKGQKKIEKIVSVILIVAIVAAVVTTVCVITFPKDGEKFTEFYILGQNKMADKYPENISIGSKQFVWVGIGNHEYQNVTYTVETLLLNAEWDNNQQTSVIHASKPLDRYQVTVPEGQTSLKKYNFKINDTGYNRIEFLLYKDNVPAIDADPEAKMNASYRDLHLWITVT